MPDLAPDLAPNLAPNHERGFGRGASTRRDCLRISMGLSAALVVPGTSAQTQALQWRERAMLGLGTTLSLRAGHANGARADAALDAAVAAIRHVEQQMSLFIADSALRRLNRDGVLLHPHADLVQVFILAQQVSQKSHGAFDVTVQPLWDVWQQAKQAGSLPSAAQVQSALARVGWQRLQVTSQRIGFSQPGMAATLNGIAQGFAGDLAQAALRSFGIQHALIDTGEWSAAGTGPQHVPWTLGLADPRHPSALIAKLTMAGGAMATSSDVHYRFGKDDKYHHIFDPTTGYSPSQLASVTVVASSCALADALTKVMFMASPARALELAKLWKVDVLVVDKAGKWQANDALRARLLA
jgi:FAD:protein FMN transferase